MSSLNRRATFSSSARPRAFTPSSLVSKIRIAPAYAGAARMLQLRRPEPKIAPYSQQLGDFFTVTMSVLVNALRRIYRPGWG
jgi:hypothetical protein